MSYYLCSTKMLIIFYQPTHETITSRLPSPDWGPLFMTIDEIMSDMSNFTKCIDDTLVRQTGSLSFQAIDFLDLCGSNESREISFWHRCCWLCWFWNLLRQRQTMSQSLSAIFLYHKISTIPFVALV